VLRNSSCVTILPGLLLHRTSVCVRSGGHRLFRRPISLSVWKPTISTRLLAEITLQDIPDHPENLFHGNSFHTVHIIAQILMTAAAADLFVNHSVSLFSGIREPDFRLARAKNAYGFSSLQRGRYAWDRNRWKQTYGRLIIRRQVRGETGCPSFSEGSWNGL